jgi:hypothetical protein
MERPVSTWFDQLWFTEFVPYKFRRLNDWVPDRSPIGWDYPVAELAPRTHGADLAVQPHLELVAAQPDVQMGNDAHATG